MKTLIFLVAFMFAALFTKAQNEEVIREEFNNNNHNWSQKQDENSGAKVGYGEYLIEQKTDAYSMRFWSDFNLASESDYYVEAKMKQTKTGDESCYGLVWNSWGWQNCNHFVISPKGYFWIYTTENEIQKDVAKLTPSATIQKTGFNTLAVERKGNSINYYINGSKVFTSVASKFFGKSTGFVLINKIAVTVDYIVVKHPEIKINLADNITYKYKQENMGSAMNSGYSEIAPIISPDGNTLFVARKGDAKGAGEYDIYFSNKLADGTWTPLQNMGKPLNNTGDNLVISVSPDGNTMLLEGLYNKDGSYQSDKGISIAYKTQAGWSIPTQVKIKNYYNLDEYESFCPTVDRKVLVMAVKRSDTNGAKDMYVSFLQNDGSYSVPKNMGKVLNTVANEGTPFIAPDNTTLYFYSEGHAGYGSADIFVSKRLDDTWTKWSKPQNMGTAINSPQWDTYYTVSASGEYAYLVSSKNSYGNEDIYSLKLEDTQKPNPVVLISGKVFNSKTQKPIAANISYENLQTGKEAGTANSNFANGAYKIVLPYGFQYGIRAYAKGYISVNENMDLTDVKAYKEVQQDLYLVPIEVGETINLKNVFFVQGKDELKSESYPELDRLVLIMKENPTMEIQLLGYTDNRASNVKLLYELSESRVKAVKEYLISKGISENRITGKGLGPENPIESNDTPEGRMLNRRVEFKITKK